MRALTLALAVFLLPVMAISGPNKQLQNQIRIGLQEYNIRTDVSALTTAQAVALHFELTSSDDKRLGSYARKRNALLRILSKGSDS